MPDQPLYPVKLATERVRLVLIPSKLGKAEYYAELVDKRVSEIVNMAEKGKLKQMEKTTERMNNQLVAMATLVRTERGAPAVLTVPSAVPEAIPAPAEVTREAPEPSVMMAPPPPEDATQAPPPTRAGEPQKGRPSITATPAKPVPEKAPVLAPAPAAVPGPEGEADEDETLDRRARLKIILAQNARKHPEALRAALQRAPELARPALLRALETSNIEYEKLLEFLEELEEESEEGEEKDDKD
jgi:hypothetical protein